VAYIASQPRSAEFLGRLEDFLEYLMPQYIEEGKYYLNVGIGCTGGRHRSVYVVETLARDFRGRGYEVSLRHRDLER
jgi:UPF0042 nucleotide-binding protein